MSTQPARATAWPMARPISAMCACMLALALAGTALADVAPPNQPPGSNIGPGGQTQVRMAAERVVLDVRPRESNRPESRLSGDLAEAGVSADFTMRNLGVADEQMQVRFPLGDPSGRQSEPPFNFPLVQGFGATVAGQPVSTTVITTPNPQGGDAPPIPWAAFDVTFPAGQDLSIGVTYMITPTGYLPEARFAYVLETGAGWADTIGSADIVVRLPYDASDENVIFGEENFAPNNPKTTAGGQFAGNEIRWHWDNLEPTAQDNLFVTVLVPIVWQRILDARVAAQAQPDNVDVLVALANAYEAAVSYHGSTSNVREHFVKLSEQTYERALALQPDSATLHAGYAELLWHHLDVLVIIDPNDPAVRRIVGEISTALALDPQNAQAKALFQEMQGAADGKLVLITPTSAPEPSAAPTPTQAAPTQIAPPAATSAPPATVVPPAATSAPPAATVTPVATIIVLTPGPAPTPSLTPQPAGTSSIPLAIGVVAALAVVMAAVVALMRRRSQL